MTHPFPTRRASDLKATREVEAVDEGVLGKILVPEGTDAVPVNQVIAVLLEDGEDASAISDSPQAKPAAKQPEQPASQKPEPTPQESRGPATGTRSEEHTSELQSLMRISYAVFCLKKKKETETDNTYQTRQQRNNTR